MGSVHLELLQIPCISDFELFPSQHIVLPNNHLRYKRQTNRADHVKVGQLQIEKKKQSCDMQANVTQNLLHKRLTGVQVFLTEKWKNKVYEIISS